jgi:transcriptional regulator with XRE-family HTH domain
VEAVRAEGRRSRPPEAAYRAAFGEHLRLTREDAQISQEDLAHAIGMSRRYLSGIERRGANPTLDQLLRLAIGLDVEVADLMPPR